MYNIGIVGLGFMGGCIVKTLIKSDKIEKIFAYDTNKDSLKLAKKEGKITDIVEDFNCFKECDVIFLCVPVRYIPKYVEKLSKIVNKECVITDIGSTKRNIIENLKDLNINFVGAHPMVGSERSGYATSHDLLLKIHITF